MKTTILTAGRDEHGDKVYNTWPGWKAACRKADPKCWFDGDIDISQALSGPKPFKEGETFAVGEWDGEKGSVFNNPTKPTAKSSVAQAAVAWTQLLASAQSISDSFWKTLDALKVIGVGLVPTTEEDEDIEYAFEIDSGRYFGWQMLVDYWTDEEPNQTALHRFQTLFPDEAQGEAFLALAALLRSE